MLTVSSLSCDSSEYSVVVLPQPVGPVTTRMPSGPRHHQLQFAQGVGGEAHLLQLMMDFSRSSMRSTMFSPWMPGWVETRKSIGRPFSVSDMRPSCGARVSAMFMPLKHFHPHQDARPVGLVQAADLFQHAVDAVADAQEGVLGLEVDVGGAALHRIDQQRADQPHHRLGVFLGLGVEAGVIDFAGLDFAQDAVERELEAVELVDAFQQLRFARQQGVDFELAAERGFQLVERDDVEHVGGGEG